MKGGREEVEEEGDGWKDLAQEEERNKDEWRGRWMHGKQVIRISFRKDRKTEEDRVKDWEAGGTKVGPKKRKMDRQEELGGRGGEGTRVEQEGRREEEKV